MSGIIARRLYLVKMHCSKCGFRKVLWLASRYESMKCIKCDNGVLRKEEESDDPVYTPFYNDISEFINPPQPEKVVETCDNYYDLFIDVSTVEQIFSRYNISDDSYINEETHHAVLNEIYSNSKPIDVLNVHNKRFKENMINSIHNNSDLVAFINDICPRVDTNKLSAYINALSYPLKIEDISMLELKMVQECYNMDLVQMQ